MGFGDCKTECPFSLDCTCLYVIKKETSYCTCTDKFTKLPMLEKEDAVNFSVRDTDLGAVAEFVHRVTGAEILIPVSKLRSRVSVELEEVTFADALKGVGLDLGPAPSADGAYSD